MSQNQTNILLDHTLPVTLKRSLDGKVLLIQGIAIDDIVNANMWQVPAEELPYFVAVSQNAQIRVDHGDRIEDVKGKSMIKILLQTSLVRASANQLLRRFLRTLTSIAKSSRRNYGLIMR